MNKWAIITLFACAMGVYAAPKSTGKVPMQTHITAKNEIRLDQAKSIISAFVDAKVERNGETLQGDEIHARYEKMANDKYRITYVWAKGHVRIKTPDKIGIGDYGTYDIDKELMTLEGHVTIIEKENEIKGDYAETNRKTGLTKVVNKQKAGGAVRALLVSKDDK
jgi:lipopolysaccharide export system protein LptA